MVEEIVNNKVDFNIDRHLISFLQDSPFFAELSRHIQKTTSRQIPTAAVAFNEKTDEIVLLWNPDFFSGLSAREVRGVITHEYYHLVFGHLYGRRRTPAKLWNVATDLAINSIIVSSVNSGNNLEGDRPLPAGCLVPGVFPSHPEGREFTDEEKQGMKLAAVIATLPQMQSSEWYFDKIREELDNEGNGEGGTGSGDGSSELDSFDDHSGWDNVPDEIREYVEGKVKAVVEKAVKHSDSQSSGWGSMPSEMIEAIRKSVSTVINWKNVLRQFVGSLVRGGRSTSIKRINKRYPYIHPGIKRGYEAKLLVAIDMSGSVDNQMLAEFFGELGVLTKKVSIDVIPFDTEACEKDLYSWRKGTNRPAVRVRCGGTDFRAPTRFANDPKNRGRWDGLCILTDGQAPSPTSSRIRRAWVLGKGCKLNFSSNETQVFMSDINQTTGSWR